jgi:hypothetical protein
MRAAPGGSAMHDLLFHDVVGGYVVARWTVREWSTVVGPLAEVR